MTIRTNPPGAVVYVDNYQIGTTPVSTNFIHYGTRNIRIVKDGYETLTVEQPIPAPWYQIPPIDFVAETMVPTEIRDHRTLNYQLVPQRIVPPDELRSRAEDLRARAAAPGVHAGRLLLFGGLRDDGHFLDDITAVTSRCTRRWASSTRKSRKAG